MGKLFKGHLCQNLSVIMLNLYLHFIDIASTSETGKILQCAAANATQSDVAVDVWTGLLELKS